MLVPKYGLRNCERKQKAIEKRYLLCPEIMTSTRRKSVWARDGNEGNDFCHTVWQRVLSGREHAFRCYPEENPLRVFPGATHPSRSEPPWEPCYNTIRLSISTVGGKRMLEVRVETRKWS